MNDIITVLMCPCEHRTSHICKPLESSCMCTQNNPKNPHPQILSGALNCC